MGPYQHSPWLLQFIAKLLRNSPPVLDLIAHNPFPDTPPRYVRAMWYRYRFTEPHSPAAQRGDWWTRELIEEYLPPLDVQNRSLQQFLAAHGWSV